MDDFGAWLGLKSLVLQNGTAMGGYSFQAGKVYYIFVTGTEQPCSPLLGTG